MLSVGFDIGGANTKMAVVDFIETPRTPRTIRIKEIETVYLPLWERLSELPAVLKNLLERHADRTLAVEDQTSRWW